LISFRDVAVAAVLNENNAEIPPPHGDLGKVKKPKRMTKVIYKKRTFMCDVIAPFHFFSLLFLTSEKWVPT
jgi:hypothetical protein